MELRACGEFETVTPSLLCSDPLSNQSIAELAKAMNLSMKVLITNQNNTRMTLSERNRTTSQK